MEFLENGSSTNIAISSGLIERVSNLMTDSNLTHRELANELGVNKSPIPDWKSGKSRPTMNHIIEMCRIFDVSADFLLFGKEGRYTEDEEVFINLFKTLDHRGRIKVLNLLYEESDRIKSQNIF